MKKLLLFVVILPLSLSGCGTTKDPKNIKFSEEETFIKVQFKARDSHKYYSVRRDGCYMDTNSFTSEKHLASVPKYTYTGSGNKNYINTLVDELVYKNVESSGGTIFNVNEGDERVEASELLKKVMHAGEKLTDVGIFSCFIYQVEEEYFMNVWLNVNWIDSFHFYYYNKEEDKLDELFHYGSERINCFSFTYLGD